jgi:uncharacterized protein YjlB
MIEPETLFFADDGMIPNSQRPVLLYRQALPKDAGAIERIFAANHWPPAWRNGVHPFHHFHSTAHEALGVARGRVKVQLGGPSGRTVDIEAGDLVVLPAGTGHLNQGQSADLLIVGAYPATTAHRLDTRRGNPSEHGEVTRNIAEVPLPSADPVGGDGGPLLRLWT